MESTRITIILTLFFASLAAQEDLPTIAMIGLCVWALRSAEHAIQALSLSVVIKFLNPVVYPQLRTASLLAWVVLGIAGLRIAVASLQTRAPRHPVLPWVLIFSLAILAHSMLVSRQSMVSSFKILTFAFGAITVLLGFKISALRSVNWTPWFTALWTAILILSLPTLFEASIGYKRNGMGFQGIFVHPQLFGLFLAPAVGWFTTRLLFYPIRETHWIIVALTCVSWSFLLLTRTRTAAVAVLGGLACVVAVTILARRDWRKQVSGALLRPVILVAMFAAASAALMFSSSIEESAGEFIFKYGRDSNTTVSEAFSKSRGEGISSEWKNFLMSPLVGHGFGISPFPSSDSEIILDPFFGLPLSAPVEKGFLPTAILEETGILGTLCLLPLLGSLIWQVSRKSEIDGTWMFFTCLLLNVGEMIFFSFGGVGLYTWLIMGWATSSQWRKPDET